MLIVVLFCLVQMLSCASVAAVAFLSREPKQIGVCRNLPLAPCYQGNCTRRQGCSRLVDIQSGPGSHRLSAISSRDVIVTGPQNSADWRMQPATHATPVACGCMSHKRQLYGVASTNPCNPCNPCSQPIQPVQPADTTLGGHPRMPGAVTLHVGTPETGNSTPEATAAYCTPSPEFAPDVKNMIMCSIQINVLRITQ
jgi:hypothetical protein